MNKKRAGLLIGAGAGLGLLWLVRDKIAGLFDKRATIDVEDVSGVPRVTFVTEEVTVKENKHVRWMVENRSQQSVTISLADWQDLKHQPVSPAVQADPDDDKKPPQKDLSREVPSGKKRPIRGRARAPKHNANEEPDEESVKYSVYLGKDVAVDPVVKLVL
jgi:hypothetical protein